jgi:hypothetical protein
MEIFTQGDGIRSRSGAARGTILLLALLALVLSVARVAVVRSDRTFVGQGYMYKEVAVALASGKGYTETHGSWRGHPTMRRPPLWPLILSLPLRVCPQCGSIAVTQYSTAVMHALTAIAGALLVWFLSGSMRRMVIALLFIALFPPAQPLLTGGYCEPLSAVVLLIGILLLCLGRRYFWAGAIVLSFLPLVRPNFLPLWASLTALAYWLQSHHPSHRIFGSTRRLLAAGLLFYTPTMVWVARNYLVSGAFPIIAGTSSMTFYGNYNSISGTIGPKFARWISPENIPGDHGVKSEAEEFRYYDSRGKEFIHQHWKIVPLMMGAHVALSLLPSPADGAHRYSFWVIRCLIYAAALLAIRRKAVTVESWFGALLACTILSTIVTVVLYSGEGRYLYPQDIIMLVLVCSARYRKPSPPAPVRENATVPEAQPQPQPATLALQSRRQIQLY